MSLCLCVCHLPSKGSEGFGAQVNKCFENAEYLYNQLQRGTDFELVFRNKVRLVVRTEKDGKLFDHNVSHALLFILKVKQAKFKTRLIILERQATKE